MEKISGTGCIKLHKMKAKKMSDFFSKKLQKVKNRQKKGIFSRRAFWGKFHLFFFQNYK
jgi:hypothetical protein